MAGFSKNIVDMLFISVVIPAYNKKNSLQSAIGSLYNQSYPKDKYEVIVVDDGSTDGTQQWVKLKQQDCSCRLRYFYQANKGPAAARNLGIRNASGDIIAFIDSDCIASYSWIEKLVNGYNNDRVAGIGGTIKARPTTSKISRYCAYIKMNEQPPIDDTGIVYLITGNASFRKSSLGLVGGFDERYNSAGGEDPDLCYRLKERGYILKYNRDAVVYNHHKEKFGEFLRTYFNYGKGDSFLVIRRFSNWDLVSVSGIRWFFNFIKLAGIMALKCLNIFSLSLKLLKIPFKMLLYYGEGLNMQEGFIYASLDYFKVFSFVGGHFFGYIIGKFKGFKKTE